MSLSVRQVSFVLSLLLAAAGARADTIATSAKWALLEDYDTGGILYDKSSEEQMPPASTSKLMVAEIVFSELKQGKLKLDDKFHVSDYAWRTGGAHSHGSTMFLQVRSDVRVEDLLRGLIIQSGNDAAITLAEGLAGTEDNFVAMMNKRAAELGMAHSHFTNAWGRSDPGELVTARDMAILARHLIRDFPDYYHFFGEKDFTWDKIKQANRNPLLAMNIGADGLKTGDTAESGYGLVGTAVQDDRRLIVIVNGLKSANERSEESRKLLTWGFRAFEWRTLFQPGDVVANVSVYGGDVGSVELTPTAAVRSLVPRADPEKITAKVVYTGPIAAPVEAGKPLGELRVFSNSALLSTTPLQTKTAAGRGSLLARAFDATRSLAGDWVRRAASR